MHCQEHAVAQACSRYIALFCTDNYGVSMFFSSALYSVIGWSQWWWRADGFWFAANRFSRLRAGRSEKYFLSQRLKLCKVKCAGTRLVKIHFWGCEAFADFYSFVSQRWKFAGLFWLVNEIFSAAGWAFDRIVRSLNSINITARI